MPSPKKTCAVYAVAFGNDGTTGDSAFVPDFFDTEHSEDWHTLVDLWRKSVGWPEDEDEIVGSPVEFHLVKEDMKTMIENCGYDCGSDSALYVMLRTLKTMIVELAIKKISAPDT